MNVDFVILADGAKIAEQKLYILGGGWTVLHSKDYPVDHPGSIAVGIMVDWLETSERHSIEVTLVDGDGHQVGDPLATGEFEVGRPPGIPHGTSQRMMFAGDVKFNLQQHGPYEVIVKIDGAEMTRSPFTAVVRNNSPT